MLVTSVAIRPCTGAFLIDHHMEPPASMGGSCCSDLDGARHSRSYKYCRHLKYFSAQVGAFRKSSQWLHQSSSPSIASHRGRIDYFVQLGCDLYFLMALMCSLAKSWVLLPPNYSAVFF